jgi:uncharacterized protein (TIRG00374 family)
MSEIDAPQSPRGFQKLFRTALVIIPIGVLGNIVFSLLITDRQLLASLDEFPRQYLLLAIGLALVPWVTNTLRLMIWTHFLGFRLRFREAFQMTLATDLGSAVSPTAVGGGFFKWGMLVQRGISPGAAASLATFPTIEDGIFFAIAVPSAIVFTESWDLPVLRVIAGEFRENAIVMVLMAGSIALATWLAVRWMLTGGLGSRTQERSIRFLARTRRRFRRTWIDARDVFHLIALRGKKWFALSFCITAVQWSARYSVISALVLFLGAPVQPVLFWLLQWVVFTLMAFIPTPGAAGGAEAAFFLIYSALLPERVIGLATAGWRFLTFYLQLGLAALTFFALDVWSRRRTAGAR